MQIWAGGDSTWFAGSGWDFCFLIKIVFVSIVPFSALCCLGCSLTSLSSCSLASCHSRENMPGRPGMAECHRGLLQDVQEMEEVSKGQWGVIDEFGQHQDNF